MAQYCPVPLEAPETLLALCYPVLPELLEDLLVQRCPVFPGFLEVLRAQRFLGALEDPLAPQFLGFLGYPELLEVRSDLYFLEYLEVLWTQRFLGALADPLVPGFPGRPELLGVQ